MKRDGYNRHARSVIRTDRPHIVTVEVSSDRDPADNPQPSADAAPLDAQELKALFGRLASQRVPIVVLSTRDPRPRDDLAELIEDAAGRGLGVGLDVGLSSPMEAQQPGAGGLPRGPLLERLSSYRSAGLDQITLAFDPETCRADETESLWRAVDKAHEVGLAVEVHTPVTPAIADRLRNLTAPLAQRGVESWRLSFLDRVAGGESATAMRSRDVHASFDQLYDIEREDRIAVMVVEAPHYRRYRAEREQGGDSPPSEAELSEEIALCGGKRADVGLWRHVTDAGRPHMFIDRYGEAYPSERLRISAGNVRTHPVIGIYRGAPVFVLLRRQQSLEGKCSQCGFRGLCGGSRARAWQSSGHVMGTDPACGFRLIPSTEK